MKLLEKIKNGQVYSIAEMSANHANDLNYALKIVEVAKESGADCLKIQTYTADTMTIDCDNDCFKITDGLWKGYTLYDLYNEASMPWEWQKCIKDKCDTIGLDFLSTPFDKTSVDFLEGLNVEFYKIASFELVDIPLIEYVASKGKPLIISTGMGSIEEIEDAVNACKKMNNNTVILLKCCSEYPANYKDMNVLTMVDIAKRFNVGVGLSDHSMGSMAAIVAVSLGAQVIEKHFCVDRTIKSPDSTFSMMPLEFKQMVEDINDAIKIRGSIKYELSEKEKESIIFRRSIFAVENIEKNATISKEDIRVIRPGNGEAPKYFNDFIGKVAKETINYGMPIRLKDIE